MFDLPLYVRIRKDKLGFRTKQQRQVRGLTTVGLRQFRVLQYWEDFYIARKIAVKLLFLKQANIS